MAVAHWGTFDDRIHQSLRKKHGFAAPKIAGLNRSTAMEGRYHIRASFRAASEEKGRLWLEDIQRTITDQTLIQLDNVIVYKNNAFGTALLHNFGPLGIPAHCLAEFAATERTTRMIKCSIRVADVPGFTPFARIGGNIHDVTKGTQCCPVLQSPSRRSEHIVCDLKDQRWLKFYKLAAQGVAANRGRCIAQAPSDRLSADGSRDAMYTALLEGTWSQRCVMTPGHLSFSMIIPGTQHFGPVHAPKRFWTTIEEHSQESSQLRLTMRVTPSNPSLICLAVHRECELPESSSQRGWESPFQPSSTSQWKEWRRLRTRLAQVRSLPRQLPEFTTAQVCMRKLRC